MTTVINNPGESGGSGAAWAIAIVVLVLIVLALVFGVPALRGNNDNDDGNVVPKIDINVGGENGGAEGSGAAY